MLAVYYPYFSASAAWDELRYSLRSLDRHLKNDFQVWIVGDLPEWIQNVNHIPHQRQFASNGLLVNDAIAKLKTFLNHPAIPDWFIRMYDDIYLLQDTSVEDLMVTRYLYKGIEKMRTNGGSVWLQQIRDTLTLLKDEGYSDYMTETHCPELFGKVQMSVLIDAFNVHEKRLLTSTLYFNVFPYARFLRDEKTERALFYGEETAFCFSSEHVAEKVKGKRYLNHNDHGLNIELKNFIKNRFNTKSRFEK